MNNYQVANDGTIFRIKEDGSIVKLGKIDNDRIVGVGPTLNDTNSGKGTLILFLILFAIVSLVLGIMLAQLKSEYAHNNAYSSYRIHSLENEVSSIPALKKRIHSLESELTNARNARDAAEREASNHRRELADFRDKIGQTVPLSISDIEIANVYEEGNIETNFGERIYSSRTMYLKPRITYEGFSSGQKTLYVKIYRPNGVMSTGKKFSFWVFIFVYNIYSQWQECGSP